MYIIILHTHYISLAHYILVIAVVYVPNYSGLIGVKTGVDCGLRFGVNDDNFHPIYRKSEA